jgi:hypothetical protein
MSEWLDDDYDRRAAPVYEPEPEPEPDNTYLAGLRSALYREAKATMVSHASFVIVSASESIIGPGENMPGPEKESKKPVSVTLTHATRPVRIKAEGPVGFVALKSRTAELSPFMIDVVMTKDDSGESVNYPLRTLGTLLPHELRGHTNKGSREVAFINLLRGLSRAIQYKSLPPAMITQRQLPTTIAAADNGREAAKPLVPGMILDLRNARQAEQYLRLESNPAFRGWSHGS